MGGRRPRHDAILKIERGETIGDDVGEEMKRAVKKGEQAGHPTEADHHIPAGEPAQRRQRERDADKPDGPDAGFVREVTERVRAEIPREPGPYEPSTRDETGEKDDRFEKLNSFSSSPCRHTGRPPGRRSR